MMEMGKLLIVFGILLIAVGLLLVLGVRLSFLGRLPGDIHIERGSWSFYFPIATSIVLSIILTLLLNLFSRR